MIFASNNKGKIKELKEVLNTDIKGLEEAGVSICVEEDEDTFFKNARKKAKEVYEATGINTIADDSGLCILELDNFPGILTHRFLGEDASDEERNNALIDKVKILNDKSAKVICSLVFYDGKKFISGEGILYGTIVDSPRGDYGFGFDSIFELSNGKTLAELKPSEKNKISARYLAAVDLKKKLREYNKDIIR